MRLRLVLLALALSFIAPLPALAAEPVEAT